MDFTTTEAATDLGGLVRTITESVCTPQHHRELDGLDERVDRDLWAKLIEADVLSAASPETLGGGGFGVLEQVAVLAGTDEAHELARRLVQCERTAADWHDKYQEALATSRWMSGTLTWRATKPLRALARLGRRRGG